METLQQLKQIALNFKIEPLNTIGHAAKVTTIIKVLTNINTSYRRFLEIEFHKNKDFHKAYLRNQKTLTTLLAELDLLAVDLKFSSCEIAVAPNIVENNITLFNDEVKDWKEESFDNYKTILEGDFNDHSYITKIQDKYSDKERNYIYKSIFETIDNKKEYKLHLLHSKNKKVKKTFHKPKDALLSFYLPKLEKEKKITTEKIVHGYFKLKDDGNEIKFSKKSIKEVFYYEELEHEIYPFTPSKIIFEDTEYLLNEPLQCKVTYEEDNYIIRNEVFDITVWGETRELAEDAFQFSFHSLVEKFYNEADRKLSNKAKDLKSKLQLLIIPNEATKN